MFLPKKGPSDDENSDKKKKRRRQHRFQPKNDSQAQTLPEQTPVTQPTNGSAAYKIDLSPPESNPVLLNQIEAVKHEAPIEDERFKTNTSQNSAASALRPEIINSQYVSDYEVETPGFHNIGSPDELIQKLSENQTASIGSYNVFSL